jgi:hypothetical protein
VIDLPRPIAVVCHDAGATNLILPWLDDQTGLLPVMQGPAEALWQTRFATTPILDLEEALSGAVSVLTGTGWASNLEHEARKMARERGLRSAAVIDHWVNYRERFVRDGAEILPDELWVTDEQARTIATNEFPGLPVKLMPNLYLEEQVSRAPPLEPDDCGVLLVAEPINSTWGRDRAGETQALDYFVECREGAGIPAHATIRLRPHPSDPPGKYGEWLSNHPGVELDASPDFAGALGGIRWVVGCESYALVIALHAGREVISALPPWAPPCRLPHREIVRLARP